MIAMCPHTSIHVPSHYNIPHTTMCPHTVYIALQVRMAITERMEHLERQVLILLCVHILIYTAFDNIRALIIIPHTTTCVLILLYMALQVPMEKMGLLDNQVILLNVSAYC